MNSKASKKTTLKQMSPSNQNAVKLLNLSLKYLRDQATQSELRDLFIQLEENLEKGNQRLFDFLSAEINKIDSDLGQSWDDSMTDLSSFDLALENRQGEELESRLFLIPIV